MYFLTTMGRLGCFWCLYLCTAPSGPKIRRVLPSSGASQAPVTGEHGRVDAALSIGGGTPNAAHRTTIASDDKAVHIIEKYYSKTIDAP
jgi:hypothetical protein